MLDLAEAYSGGKIEVTYSLYRSTISRVLLGR